ncbi:MAG: sugar ABC transporter permease [Anaerolineae bacterium]|nr:sugar ABC transporter permease [Anaerolineae bacterium]
MIIFDLYPFVANVVLGFTDFRMGGSTLNWIGFANYTRMFNDDPLFLQSLGNTIQYAALSVPLSLLLAFGIALLLNMRIRAMGVFRVIYYIPSIVPIVASAVLFSWLFNTRYGVINEFLFNLGLTPQRWLTSASTIMPTLIIISLWGFGAQMVIFLAGLQAVPEELYEAVSIDGGGRLHRLRYITIPLMTPVIFFNLVIGVISSFQSFALVYVLFGPDGGTLQSGLLVVVHIYNNVFRYFNLGYASALTVVLFIIVLALTLVMVRTSKRWVFYGND